MPDVASSAAAIWVSPRNAHLDEPYAAWLGNGRIAPVLQVLTIEAPSACRKVSSDGRIPRNGPRQLTRQLASKPVGVSSASDARCSTPALFTSVGQGAEPVDGQVDRDRPLLLRCDVERNSDTPPSADALQVVDQPITCGDPKPVLVQSLDDRRTLPARGAGHQGDTLGPHCASLRCSAAPRRSACGLRRERDHPEAHLSHGLSALTGAGVDAGDQAGGRRGGTDTRHRIAHGRVGPCFGEAVSHRDRQVGRADVDTG